MTIDEKTDHTCHWPGCNREVPPKMWGCKPHWMRLPKSLRDRIWETYRPGQEVTKTPSREYLQAAMDVRTWIMANFGHAIDVRDLDDVIKTD